MSEAAISEKPPVIQTHTSSNQPLRYLQATAFVGIWMTMGWVYHLDGNSYLLIGVPLVVAFQVFIRKKPLVALWVRDATRFRLNHWGIILAFAFTVLPINDLVDLFKSSSGSLNMPVILWKICCVVGAFGVGFSLGHFTRQTWKSLLFCMATAGVIGCGIMIGPALLNKHSIDLTGHKVLNGLRWFALYFPVCFVIEEVAFRGAIDSHVHQPGDKLPWLSALYISAIWGLWHLPIAGVKEIPVIVVAMLLMSVHMATGVFLSFGWRRSGNLAVTSAVHALIDAVRNVVWR